jgi:hypothetical protein
MDEMFTYQEGLELAKRWGLNPNKWPVIPLG